jgi:5'-nucleotidase
MPLPHLLVTNDDGIDSYFLRVLVEAHRPWFRVSVAAPSGEQSWIGRAFSRLRDVRVEPRAAGEWAIDGTPSDCVNIALGCLLAADRPDAVIAGVNIGSNITMPLSLSSGTLAGAIEGAAWGLPALAYSLELPDEEYLHAQHNRGEISGAGRDSLLAAAARAALFTRARLGETAGQIRVHNINFPRVCAADTPDENTVPAEARLGALFREKGAGVFRFHWNKDSNSPRFAENSDAACLRRGHISHSVLDYGALGTPSAPFAPI